MFLPQSGFVQQTAAFGAYDPCDAHKFARMRGALCVLRGFRVVFDKKDVEKKLQQAFEQNSEHELLSILKDNSFLFYDLYDTKWGIRPNFAQVPFGSKYRSDFCWLNDNSDGPEL
ncbi:MAG: hypothetical protein ACRAU9_05360 [Shewanella xiamenensis]